MLVKIEDKKECKIMKELLKDIYIFALYTGDIKEAKLNEDALFDLFDIQEDVDVIISISCSAIHFQIRICSLSH